MVLVKEIRKNVQSMYQKNAVKIKHIDLLHPGRKYFCHYYLRAFRTAEKLKCQIKDCFKINGKQQKIKTTQKDEYISSKIMK